MSKPEKKKLCWNCEGNVSRSAENCPYCAVYLNPESGEEAAIKPFYSPQDSTGAIPKAPYLPIEEGPQEEQTIKSERSEDHLLQSIFLPIILLTAGLFSLLFAAILFLFSTNGVLTLEWDGELWYLYPIVGVPLLLVGLKLLLKS